MPNLDLTIQRKSETGYPVIASLAREDGALSQRREGTLSLNLAALADVQYEPLEYGMALGKALFVEEIRDTFCEGLSSDETLHIHLSIEAPDLRALDWHRLTAPFEAGRWRFLAVQQSTPFSLDVPSAARGYFPAIGRRDLRALILVAGVETLRGSYKLAPFDVAATTLGIQTALGNLPNDVLANPSLDTLCATLTGTPYTILHLVCHGAINDKGETILYFPKDASGQPVQASELLNRLANVKNLPHFIFLSTCESALPQNGLGSLAQRLVRELGLPAALAMTDKISIATAQAIAAPFYTHLQQHGQPDLALAESLAGLQGQPDLTIPALLSRLGGRPLFSDALGRDLTDKEMEFGLVTLAALLSGRAPVLTDSLDTLTRRLRATLGAEAAAQSESSRSERKETLSALNELSLDGLDLSFNAICLGQTPPAYDNRSPFRGLESFRPEDSEFFLGREELTKRLLQKLNEHNFLAVLGASGSGKSSLVMAGLVPAMNVPYAIFRPGLEPLSELEKALQGEPALLVVDQFEELFTLTRAEQRPGFIQRLLEQAGKHRVVVTMRADFLGEVALFKSLKDEVQNHQEIIPPMDAAELRRAMEGQAGRVGLRFESDLSQQMLDDVEGQAGAMPLLQHALWELWKRRHGRWLRADEYRAFGGVKQAIASTAEEVFAKCSTAEQTRLQDIFLRLTRLDEGGEGRDTRRRVKFDELVPADSDSAPTRALVAQLATSRLIMINDDQVEVAHEALIRYWPRLKKWIDENRGKLKLRESIRENALEWESHNQDESFLDHRGARLEEALALSKQPNFGLNTQEQVYLEACVSAEKQEQVRRERLRKRIMASLAVGCAILFVFAAFAVFQWQNAEKRRQESLSRQLAAQAMAIQAERPELALLLGVQANKINDNFDARSSLLSASQCCSDALISFMSGHTDSVWDVAFSPDGTKLASSGNDGTIILWEVATRQEITRIINPDASATVYSVAFSPTEPILAAGDGTGLVILYNTQTWQRIGAPLRVHDSSVLVVKFSKDGSLLVSSGTDGKVLVWDMATQKLVKTFTGNASWIWDVAISPDNKTVVSVGRDKTLRLWNLEPGASVEGLKVPTLVFASAAFNDDAQHPLLLTGDTTGKVTVWDMRPWQEKHEPPLASKNMEVAPGASTSVWGLAFVPGEGLSFVTGRGKGTLNRNKIVANSDFSQFSLKPEMLGVTAHSIGVFRIDISPEGKLIAVAGQDGLVSLWNASEVPSVIRHNAKVNNLQILTSGTNIVSVDTGGNIFRWDYVQQKILAKLTLNTRQVLQSGISLDGTKVATATDAGLVSLWDAQTGKRLSMRKNHSTKITSLVFSPDGRQLASSDDQGNVILWDVTNGNALEPAASFTDTYNSAIQMLLFSSDGATLIGGGCGYPITFPSPDCSQGAIFVWDTQPKLQLRYKLPGKAGFVWSMALNPANPDELVTGTRDGTITIWNLRERTARLTIRLGASDITALAFSPDGTLLAVGANGYKVILYSSQTGQVYGGFFKEHDTAVIAMVFSPDGYSLFSASTDETIVTHDLRPETWLTRACRIANRNLTRSEWKQYLGDTQPYQAICPDLPIEPEITVTPNGQAK